ncbi:hypothetical protein H6P81_006900 [Aristolochia fimbriata]|uniref:SUF system FeS cluster assembly SufBD core domain-containing protein n=1 Tax=Aristolochia fimbriata TaxID=158543 RepID=A0AAV7EZU5_ARIFI|nr:hypothetical protein H6P81_006900 [Aristolochia fimbriata]
MERLKHDDLMGRSHDTSLNPAIVELYCEENGKIKYAMKQNWYRIEAGEKVDLGNKEGLCFGYRSKILWIQVQKGSIVTWKYPTIVLEGKVKNNTTQVKFEVSS